MAQRPFGRLTLAHALKAYNWPKYAQTFLPLGGFSACRLCGSGDAPHGICVACTADLPWFLPAGSRLRIPHGLDYLQVAMRYEFPINQLIAAAKTKAYRRYTRRKSRAARRPIRITGRH